MLLLWSTIIKSCSSQIDNNITTITTSHKHHTFSSFKGRTRSFARARRAAAAAADAVPWVFRTSDSTIVTAYSDGDDYDDDDDYDESPAASTACCHRHHDDNRRHSPRAVGFTKVMVQEHCLVLGDHPSCSGSFPITLDWKHASPIQYTVEEHQAFLAQKTSGGTRSQQQQQRPRRRQMLIEGVAGPASALSKKKTKAQAQQPEEGCPDLPASPRRLSAMERCQRLLAVTDMTLSTLQQEEFKRRVKLFGLLETTATVVDDNNETNFGRHFEVIAPAT